MNRIPLYRVLQTESRDDNFTLACVLEGDFAGEQLLLRNGRPIWQAGSGGFLRQHSDALRKITATGVCEVGGVRVFAERFGAPPQLVVCGGGHVATSVVRLARLLDLPTFAMDDREEYAQKLRSAGADTAICLPFEQALQQVPGGEETYFVVVTRAHEFDVVCLRQILQKPAAYVGMMGSRGRAQLVRRQLLEQGADVQRVEALYAPIGLSIGSQTAEEIALSIMTQIVSIKNQRTQTEGFPPGLLEAMRVIDETGGSAVLATIVARHGSTPREVGAKMLILPDGKTTGSVGGGIMEHRTILAAQKMLMENTLPCCVVHFSADGQNADAALAACGGSMELLLEKIVLGEGMK